MNVNVTITDEPLQVGSGKIETNITRAEAGDLADAALKHVKEVPDGVPGCCIDGRTCEQCLDGSIPEVRPGCAGGPLVTAYAAAVLTGWFGDKDPRDLESRLTILNSYLESVNIITGAHVDSVAAAVDYINAQTGEVVTGCGAADRAPQIIDTIYEASDTVKTFEQIILDEAFSDEATIFVPREVAREAYKDWNPKKVIDTTNNDNGHSVERLKADESETHGHVESMVFFSYAENCSLDRDAFVAETGAQVFWVDMWYIKKIAAAMTRGPESDAMQSNLLHAMTAYQVATYATLTNGSQYGAFLRGDFTLVA